MQQGMTATPAWTAPPDQNADQWAINANEYKVPVDQTPAVDSVAQWNGPLDGAGNVIGTGHVGWVIAVTASSITVRMDDYYTQGEYPDGYTATALIMRGSDAWPDNFIHFLEPPAPVWSDVSPKGKAQDNDVFNAVSCFGTDDCVAVGKWYDTKDEPHALIENYSGSWSPVSSPQPTGQSELDAVSCPTPAYCVAVGDNAYTPLIETFNKSRWRVTPPGPAPYGGQLLGVSCPSASYCVAVGEANGYALVYRFDGSVWSASRGSVFQQGLAAVSCASATSCLAVGSPGVNAIFMETISPEAVKPVPAKAIPTALAGLGMSLTAVSCPSTSSCTMVGYQPGGTKTLIGTYNGKALSVVTEPSYAYAPPGKSTVPLDDFAAVSCSAPSTCAFAARNVQLGTGGEVVATETGSGWATASVADVIDNGGGANAVSCSATGFCLAVGSQSAHNMVVPLALSVTL
jgi:hypothetical protein